MTANPFAALLAKIGRYSHDCDEPHLVPEPDGKWLDRDEVLAALAAAYPADLAEAGEMARRLLNEHDAFSGHAADTITALIARIAAQEAQIKGLEKDLDRRTEMHECAMSERDDATLYADEQKARAEAAETTLASERAKVAKLVEAGPPFFFDRYINGVRMAEDVCVERETTLEGAMRVAARIAAKGPNGEPLVLVYRSTETAARAAITEAGQ